MRKTDAVIRYGGEEFVIIFHRLPGDVFRKKLEEIRAAVDRLTIAEHPGLHVSVSLGGAYGVGKTTELFETADRLMYQAKKSKNKAIAGLVSDEELNEDFIMPEPFDPRVADVVSQAVKSHIEA